MRDSNHDRENLGDALILRAAQLIAERDHTEATAGDLLALLEKMPPDISVRESLDRLPPGTGSKKILALARLPGDLKVRDALAVLRSVPPYTVPLDVCGGDFLFSDNTHPCSKIWKITLNKYPPHK